MAQRVKRLPAIWETWVRFLGGEDPLEKEIATHTSTLAWKIPWTEKPGRLQFTGSQSQTRLSDFTFSYFWLHSVFTVMHRLSLAVEGGGHSLRGARACHCGGLSCRGAWPWTRAPWNTRQVLPASCFLSTQICLSTSLSSFLSVPTSLSLTTFMTLFLKEENSHLFTSLFHFPQRCITCFHSIIILRPLLYHKMETALTNATRSLSFLKFIF